MSVYNNSVAKAIRILNWFAENKREINLKELSETLEVDTSTLYRLLSTLVHFDYLEKNNDLNYSLGPAVVYLSTAYSEKFSMRKISDDFLAPLRNLTGETVAFGVRREKTVVYLEQLNGLEAIGVSEYKVGKRDPLHCTATGKIIMAFVSDKDLDEVLQGYEFTSKTSKTITDKDTLLKQLKEIKNNGYSFNREENDEGLAAVAAPVFNRDGIYGGVGISGLASRIYEKSTSGELIGELVNKCNEISRLLGGGKYLT